LRSALAALPPARRVLPALWLLAGIVLVTAGWFGFAGRTAPGGSSRYVEGVIGQVERVNPLFAQPDTAEADISALVFNGLTRPRGDGIPVAGLAESWDISPDGLTYTFHLHAALSWHDGAPLTARDVAFTIATVQNPGFRGLPALAADWAGVEVATPDERTVVVTLRAPSSSFLSRAAMPVLPEHLLRGVPVNDLLGAPFGLAPVGSGPYRVRELGRDRAILDANPSYHLGPPAIPEIELRFYRDEGALAASIERGDVDAALLPDGADGAAARAAATRDNLARTVLPRAGYVALYLNNQRPPLDEVRTRLALAAVIDRDALARDVLGAEALTGVSPLVPGSWAAPSQPAIAYGDVDALFAEAGWFRGQGGVRARNGVRLSLTLETNADPRRTRLAEAVAAQLRAAGVEVEVISLPAIQLVQQRLLPRDYSMVLFAWDTGPDPDPYGAWHTSQIAGAGRNFSGFHDVLTDATLEQARSTLDQVERMELYRRFETRFLSQAPSIVLYYPGRAYVHPAGLAGLDTGLQFDTSSRFRDVQRWHVVRTPAR
jgi:peptide/nickel transport system substrate-binding protein